MFFPLSNAVDNLRAVGFGAGSSNKNTFELDVQNLVDGDLVSGKSCSDWRIGEDEFSDRESFDSESFERKALEFFCGDLMEEVFDEDSCDSKTVQLKPDAKTSRKRASRKLKIRINKSSVK